MIYLKSVKRCKFNLSNVRLKSDDVKLQGRSIKLNLKNYHKTNIMWSSQSVGQPDNLSKVYEIDMRRNDSKYQCSSLIDFQ